jgi:spermidine synthase
VLLAIVLVIATAGLVYELAMAAVASYVLGDSVTQFSTVIGVYLSALGIGAYLSRFIERQLSLRFVDVELATALLGGLSAPALLLAFSYTGAFRLVLYSTVLAVGVLVGLELPLLMRILRRELAFKELVAKALTFDYAGALIGSLAFSLLLVPRLGLVNSSIVCGLLNAVVGLASTWVLPVSERELGAMRSARIRAYVVTAILAAALGFGDRLVSFAEASIYAGRVLHAEQSAYQRIVLARRGDGFQLYLNGNLQLSSADEHRYHEALVHPAMQVAERRARIVVGGGGDGLGVREILRWPDAETITVVDLDPQMTSLARTHPLLTRQNQGALDDPRVQIVNADATVWLASTRERFDVVLLDFPDPTNYSLGKLYSVELYANVKRHLAPGGALVVQAASPFFARRAYWSIVATLESAGFFVLPYRVFVPSFGEWGFALAKHAPFARPQELPLTGLRFLDDRTLAAAFALPADLSRVEAPVNRLNNQALVGEYLDAWSRWN